MKIMVLSSSGNVGKSLISSNLFYPRLDDPLIVEVETVNKGNKELKQLNVQQFKAGDDFADLYIKMVEVDNLIVDVGASNLAQFFDQMREYAGVEQFFDFFVVPTVPADKEMTDTYKTILFLRALGIEDLKIKVIFNRVRDSVAREFAPLLAVDFAFDEDLYIKDSSLFTDLGLLRKTIADIYNSDLDSYKPKILAAKDPAEKLLLVKMDIANRQAAGIKQHFDDVFARITGESPVPDKPVAPEPSPAAPKQKAKKAEELEEEFATSEEDEDL